jgi:hypothetical protein
MDRSRDIGTSAVIATRDVIVNVKCAREKNDESGGAETQPNETRTTFEKMSISMNFFGGIENKKKKAIERVQMVRDGRHTHVGHIQIFN